MNPFSILKSLLPLGLMITLGLSSCVLHAQILKGSQKAFEKGEDQLAKKNYESAKKLYLKCISIDSTHALAYLRLAGLARRGGDLIESKRNLLKAIALDPAKYKTYHFNLGEMCWEQGQYEEVASYLDLYLKHGVRNPTKKRKAQKLLRDAQFILHDATTYDTEVTILPPTINSQSAEYLPSLPAAENLMVFTRRVNGQEDFFISHFQGGLWSEAKAIQDLNTPENEGAHCLSADGKLLIFTACARPDGLGSCDLYYSVLKDGQWTTPRNLGPQVNSRNWDAQPSLSASGTTLYFSSDRPGGQGGRDLWKSNRTNTGWSNAINLGDINTIYNEEAPYIHFDNESLYFMSDGHPGFGGYDLFLSRKDVKWQEPINLGKPVNTSEDEGALHVDRLGLTGYFARSAPPQSGLQVDILSFPIPLGIKPNPATYVNIAVVDNKTKQPLQAIVEVYDLSSEVTFLKTITNQQGELLVCLNTGKDYALSIDQKDYLFYSSNISLTGERPKLDPEKILAELQPLERIQLEESSEPVILDNVFFVFAKAELLPSSEHELEKLLALLEGNEDLSITIQGHTDNVGRPEDNLKLSIARAKAVRDYLVAKGISENRLKFEGYGEMKPIATNATEDGRQTNRRTEFLIN